MTKIPSNRPRPKDLRTRDFPLVKPNSVIPAHSEGRRPPGPGTPGIANVSPGPQPVKMPKARTR